MILIVSVAKISHNKIN